MKTTPLLIALLAATVAAGAAAQSSSAWPAWTIGVSSMARSEISLGGTVERWSEPRYSGSLLVGGEETVRIRSGIDSSAYYLRALTDGVDLDVEVWSRRQWRRGTIGPEPTVAYEGGRCIEFRAAGLVVSRTEDTIVGAGRQTWHDSLALTPTRLFYDLPYRFFDAGLGVRVLVFGDIEVTAAVQCTSEVATGTEPDARFSGTGGITMLGESFVAAIYGAPTLSTSVVVTEPEFADVTISPDLAVGAGGLGGEIDYELAPQDLELAISRDWSFLWLPDVALFSHRFAGDRGVLRL